MTEPVYLQGLRLFGRHGLFDLTLEDGRIASIRPSTAGGAGLLALPGFHESHAHLFPGGVALEQLNLSYIHDATALRAVLLPHAVTTPVGELVCAYAANYDLLGGPRPDRHALDAILPDRPLCITATDFHCAWANTAALRAAGVLQGCVVDGVEMAEGMATGELREFAAMDLVRRLAPSAEGKPWGCQRLNRKTLRQRSTPGTRRRSCAR